LFKKQVTQALYVFSRKNKSIKHKHEKVAEKHD